MTSFDNARSSIKKKPKALVIDDEPDICELIRISLDRMNIETIIAHNYHQALRLLQDNHYQLCFTDMRLPDGDGLDLLNYIQKNIPHLPVAVITAHGTMDSAITALKRGAFDFVSKPIDLEMLRGLAQTALRLEEPSNTSEVNILGNSKVTQELREKISKVSRSQAPVYISGPSGSGKELVARVIHQLSPRSDQPFVPVNCGAIPKELMESEFFGHLRGSFTGAHQDKKGLFQAAHKGTLLLDEVGDLPLEMQVKLLRAIQERAIRPIGSSKEVMVDVRILSSTHKNLYELVKCNQFREDLFYRLNVIELKVPGLRERAEDIPQLT
ncbi:MAG TPA: sigma-54 dependent transcriptional regulator, partial [Gammaproteobacteria bacterium]|nr:sigma-54 dependent transcriptional regulator [Gammaproteobacteria bacterium]